MKPAGTTKADTPLKIGLVLDTTLDSDDGVQQYVKTLGAWLVNRGHRVHYITGSSRLTSLSGGQVHSVGRNLTIRFNGNLVNLPLWSRATALKRLKSEHFDLLHVQLPHSPLLAHRLVRAAPAATAVVGTFHILPAGPAQAAAARFLRRLYGGLERFDDMLAVSPAAAAFARRAFGLECAVLPNVVDVSQFAAGRQTDATKPRRLVFLGRLVPRKGALELLRAFALLADRHSDIELLMAGDGPQRGRLQRFISQHRLESRVSLLGRVSEADKPGLLGNARLAIFPSLYGESFGIVLLEAMAAGAEVVVGGDNPGYRSVLGDRPQTIVRPRDTAALANQLETLLADDRLREELHAWQQKLVRRFDVNEVGPLIMARYRRAIAQRAAS